MNIIELTPEDLKRRNSIGWCSKTLNPGLYGCRHVSPACGKPGQPGGCYAEAMAARMARMNPDSPYVGATTDGKWTGGVRVDYDRMIAAFDKLPKRGSHDYFVTAMSDLFHKDVPDAFIDRVFVEMNERPHHVFKVLTKRIERVAGWFEGLRAGSRLWGEVKEWPRNVFIGTTVEDQRRADERIPHLLRVPAAVRFVSVEPMLTAIDLTSIAWPTTYDPNHRADALRGGYWNAKGWLACGPAAQLGEERGGFTNHSDMPGWPNMIAWVIIGSQSDGNRPGPKETKFEWVRDLRDQCVAAGVPLFCKQLAIDGRLVTAPEIDGRRWLQMPDPGAFPTPREVTT